MTTEKYKRARELFEELGGLEARICHMRDTIGAFRQRKNGNFALRDTEDGAFSVITIPQEEALPFYERHLARMEERFMELEKEFEEL